MTPGAATARQTRTGSRSVALRPEARRCAIYSRKSVEERHATDFGSIDAQREAGAAYVRSREERGWSLLPTRYEDEGFSGANTERPALQRLLADIAARRIDVVVVYKVDRLSRSLLDFAKLMDAARAGAALRTAFKAISRSANENDDGGRSPCRATRSRKEDEGQVGSLALLDSHRGRGPLPLTCPGTTRGDRRRLRARRGRVGGWQRARPRGEPSAAPAWTAWALLVTALSVGGAVATFGGGLLLWVNLTPFAGMGVLGAGFLLALWGLVARR